MLEQALADHNMGDREASKDIITEVDTDNVSMNNARPPLFLLVSIFKTLSFSHRS